MVNGGGAERIACGKHYGATLRPQLGCDLANGRGLARTVDADDECDEGLCFLDRERFGHRREDLFHFSGDDRLHLIGRDRFVIASFADRHGDPCGRFNAEIDANEQILDFIEHRLVEPALGHEIADSAADRGGRALETSAEPLPPALLLARLIVHIVLVRSGLRA